MEKCWFVLKQSHYPPPDLPETGIGIANGPISLGHIIPDSIDLDNVINRSENGIKFTPAVRIHPSKSWMLDWTKDRGLEAGLSANASAPIGAGVPVSAGQHTQFAFESTEKNHQQFETLDRYIIQVNRKFIRRILEDKDVAEHIERTKGVQLLELGGSWSVFMITGIIVAKGAKGGFRESRKIEARASASVNVINAASGDVAANFANSNTTSMLAGKSSDFVWAVRLTKIWKTATEKDWKFRTETKGATFSLNDEKPWKDEIQKILSQEFCRVGDFQTLDLSDEEGMIVF